MPLLYRIKILKPLNLIDYDPEKAKSILMKEIGFKDYGKNKSLIQIEQHCGNIYKHSPLLTLI